MRVFTAVVLLCLASVSAQARPSPYLSVTQYDGDRISARQAHLGPEVVRAVKAKTGAKARPKNLNRRATAVQRKWRAVPAPMPRPLAYEPYRVEAPVSIGEGVWRETKRAAGRPRAWCGWWLGQHLGMLSRHLWLARNWAAVGSSAGGPHVGAIVVWRHHVGLITGRSAKGWIVKSGNDGGRVRERARSVAAAIAFRDPHGNST